MKIPFSAIQGIRLGHMENSQARTGCTVMLVPGGACAGVDVRGGAPGSRETDALRPENSVEQVHALFLTGGSAFGLDCAGGIMRYLEERGEGFALAGYHVPIVAGAVLFDLQIGDGSVRPDAEMGYAACVDSERGLFREGRIGAGCGATVGKYKGPELAADTGLGIWAEQFGDVQVGAIVAVNALGNVIDKDGSVLAGMRREDGSGFEDAEAYLLEAGLPETDRRENTTIAIVVTNARLQKAQCQKASSMAHDGLARSIRPSHTMMDGDSIFCLATGKVECDVNRVGVLAARVLEKAVRRAAGKKEEE